MRLADVQFTSDARAVVARLTGEIDLSNADSIGQALVDAMPNHALALVLDLSDMDHLDSAGIQLIFRLHESLRARGQVLRAVIPSGSAVSDTLRLSGAGGHIASTETVEDAVQGLQ